MLTVECTESVQPPARRDVEGIGRTFREGELAGAGEAPREVFAPGLFSVLYPGDECIERRRPLVAGLGAVSGGADGALDEKVAAVRAGDGIVQDLLPVQRVRGVAGR